MTDWQICPEMPHNHFHLQQYWGEDDLELFSNFKYIKPLELHRAGCDCG
jgi:hypothetical protein